MNGLKSKNPQKRHFPYIKEKNIFPHNFFFYKIGRKKSYNIKKNSTK